MLAGINPVPCRLACAIIRFGGAAWQKNAPTDAYWNNSPLRNVANVKTPTIFLVGEKDVRVPMPQSVMYRPLKSNGVPTHLYVAPREPHGWQELRHELFNMNVELEWFEKYATHRPYVRERAPVDAPRRKPRRIGERPHTIGALCQHPLLASRFLSSLRRPASYV